MWTIMLIVGKLWGWEDGKAQGGHGMIMVVTHGGAVVHVKTPPRCHFPSSY
jgi:hypothetical protein